VPVWDPDRLGGMLIAVVVVGVLLALLLPLVGLTVVGARQRGAGAAFAAVAGLCFPVTWTVWYLSDRPVRHASGS
jgi:hypothetical protein